MYNTVWLAKIRYKLTKIFIKAAVCPNLLDVGEQLAKNGSEKTLLGAKINIVA